jgi:small-conductance mechanosensitive channel
MGYPNVSGFYFCIASTSIMNFFDVLGEWALSNLPKIIYSAVIIVLGYVFQKILSGRIENEAKKKRLSEHLAFILIRFVQWGTIIAVFSVVLLQFGVTLAVVSGFVTLVGGTIIGFAAINTLGNAIAGLIVMTSKPFKVGDRIYFNGRFSDVISIDLIYTKLRTLDLVYVSVPNQELLKSEIEDFGIKNIIRRSVTITAGYEHESSYVKKALLEAVSKVEKVLKAPEPHVFITDFQNYAVQYTLYYFLREVKRMPWIADEVREAVFKTCSDYGIDLSTPLLSKRAD